MKENCKKSKFSEFLNFLSNQPRTQQNWLIKTLCIVCVILAIGAASGLTIGIGAYIYDFANNTQILENILPNSEEKNNDANLAIDK